MVVIINVINATCPARHEICTRSLFCLTVTIPRELLLLFFSLLVRKWCSEQVTNSSKFTKQVSDTGETYTQTCLTRSLSSSPPSLASSTVPKTREALNYVCSPLFCCPPPNLAPQTSMLGRFHQWHLQAGVVGRAP